MNLFVHLQPRLLSCRSLRTTGISISRLRLGIRPSPFLRQGSLLLTSRHLSLTRALRNETSLGTKYQVGDSKEFPDVSPEELKTILQEVKRPKVVRPIVFSVLVMTVGFAAAAAQTNNSVSSWMSSQKYDSGPVGTALLGYYSRALDHKKESLEEYKQVNTYILAAPAFLRPYLWRVCSELCSWAKINDFGSSAMPLVDGYRTAWAIVAVCSVVCVAWRLGGARPGLKQWMNTHFVHRPVGGRSYTLLTSVFSHEEWWHLACNSVTLLSFAPCVTHWMYDEQWRKSESGITETTAIYHFLAFFVAAGVFASLCHHLHFAAFQYPRIIAQLSSQKFTPPLTTRLSRYMTTLRSRLFNSPHPKQSTTPQDLAESLRHQTKAALIHLTQGALGMSGAVCACIANVTLQYPDLEIRALFVIPLQASHAVAMFVAFDVLGLLCGWRLFAHAAHLGGFLFGALYFTYGMRCWDWIRVKCCEWQGLQERLILSEGQKTFIRLLNYNRE